MNGHLRDLCPDLICAAHAVRIRRQPHPQRKTARSRSIGGMIWGVSSALFEEIDEHANALGSKSVGELGICGAGTAVTNAIYNACGAGVRDYPITLDKVLPALS